MDQFFLSQFFIFNLATFYHELWLFQTSNTYKIITY